MSKCSPNSKLLCGSDECEICFNRSFASNAMAESWSSKNTFRARDVMKASEKKAWFTCKTCNHDFETILYSIKSTTYCPYCSNQRLCDSEDCIICFNKTCASHEMATTWSSKNTIVARKVFLQSNKKYIFNCSTCKHEYQTTPNHYFNRGGKCPYCINQILCDNESCKLCFAKSFASHERIVCWSSKNTINPRMLFKGSETKCLFNCDKCKCEFNSKLYNVLTGYWCPFCKNKTEGKVLQFLQENYPNCKSQLRFDWCRYSKTNNIMPFDFGFQDRKLLIELDGRQHFQQISNWDAPEITQAKDIEKISNAIKAGYSVIHIYQDEVWKDSYNWKEVLKSNIDLLIKEEKPQVLQADPLTLSQPSRATALSVEALPPLSQVLFISKDDVYRIHIEKLDSDIVFRKIQIEV